MNGDPTRSGSAARRRKQACHELTPSDWDVTVHGLSPSPRDKELSVLETYFSTQLAAFLAQVPTDTPCPPVDCPGSPGLSNCKRP